MCSAGCALLIKNHRGQYGYSVIPSISKPSRDTAVPVVFAIPLYALEHAKTTLLWELYTTVSDKKGDTKKRAPMQTQGVHDDDVHCQQLMTRRNHLATECKYNIFRIMFNCFLK